MDLVEELKSALYTTAHVFIGLSTTGSWKSSDWGCSPLPPARQASPAASPRAPPPKTGLGRRPGKVSAALVPAVGT